MSREKITPLIMPKWGLSMKEGKLSDWLIEEGADISVGDEIMEVETDKIANVVEAADPGLLRRCVAVAGEVYPVRALLGVLAPQEVSDADIDAFIEAYETPRVEDEDDADEAPQYAFAETSAGRLRYAVRGDEGPAVLLIHGFGGDLDNWLFNMDALAEKAKVYALDLPGHGQSTKRIADPGLSGLANAVRAFMDTVGVKSAHLVGHSLGGAVAATVASDAPDRVLSLSLVCAAGLGPEINSAYIDGFVTAVSRRDLKPVLQLLFADAKLVSRAMVEDLLKYKRLDGVREALTQLSSDLFADGRQSTILSGQISELGVRTLVIWGAEDRVIPASHARNLDAADVEIIEHAGHMVQMEQAAKVNDRICGHIFN
ncbi:MAG: acetoin dehydrogenase dihydrolipoyllysine-residue acetyltransferase subunit [Proteobacteria bacterium]|nr:acetoin dehydrogenase dihydrolipoyllysine-residue acetyltransferase subunit [Pseudomonadota bacterium]